ncbi:MAG: ComF family protein [Bergeyella sp.]|nr:ComF family protein [Bergeyella sp.]
MTSRLGSFVRDIFLPSRCLGCGRIVDAEVCLCFLCEDKIHFLHESFSDHNELRERCSVLFPVQVACSLMKYERNALAKKMIHSLKYGQRESIGQYIARMAIERLDIGALRPDLLVSIPLHLRKYRKRGYNQLHLFTETLSEYYHIPYDHKVLKRNKHLKSQAQKNKSARQKSDFSFSLNREIENTHVLLIDDVFTTGQTLAQASWAVLSRKNNKVSILVMAMEG